MKKRLNFMKDEAYWNEIKELNVKAESYVDSVVSPARVGGHKSLTIPKQRLLWREDLHMDRDEPGA